MSAAARRLRVLVVDDSALVRQILTEHSRARSAAIEVVGAAPDPFSRPGQDPAAQPGRDHARCRNAAHGRPDLPEKLMRLRPMPVVMVSSLTERGCDTLRRARAGAVDVVTKPRAAISPVGMPAERRRSCAKVAAAAGARSASTRRPIQPPTRRALPLAPPLSLQRHRSASSPSAPPPAAPRRCAKCSRRCPPDARASSSCSTCPSTSPAPSPTGSNAFARMRVNEARRRRPRAAGPRPASRPATTTWSWCARRRRLPCQRHRRRAACSPPALGRRAVPLRGRSCRPQRRGRHPDRHGRRRRRAACSRCARPARYTIAQDEATCVVFGMPKEAIARGGAELIEPLPRVAQTALRPGGGMIYPSTAQQRGQRHRPQVRQQYVRLVRQQIVPRRDSGINRHRPDTVPLGGDNVAGASPTSAMGVPLSFQPSARARRMASRARLALSRAISPKAPNRK